MIFENVYPNQQTCLDKRKTSDPSQPNQSPLNQKKKIKASNSRRKQNSATIGEQ
jgi:hypothetical protein